MEDTTNAKEILERLRQGTSTDSDTDLGRKLGVGQQSVSNARKAGKVPDSWIRKAAEDYGLSADYLLFGIGPMQRGWAAQAGVAPNGAAQPGMTREGAAQHTRRKLVPDGDTEKVVSVADQETVEAPSHQIIMIPMVEARLSAGHGSFETDGTSERKYSFRSDFLRRKGKLSEMVLMRVEGDSMTPEVRDGDVVLIDQSQTAPKAGNIYAVGVEDMVYLKRVNAAPGKIILSSFNTEYPPFEIDTRGDLESSVRIIGRVIWSCREW